MNFKKAVSALFLTLISATSIARADGLPRVDVSVRNNSEHVMFGNLTVSDQAPAVPEPMPISLLALGVGLAGVASRRRKRT